MLKAQLAPHGLGGAAMGFDKESMTREMQHSADTLLERFVEVQAQQLSLAVSERMETTDWLQCPPPKEVPPDTAAPILSSQRELSAHSTQTHRQTHQQTH